MLVIRWRCYGGRSLVFLCIVGVFVLGIWTTDKNTRDFLADNAELASESLFAELKRFCEAFAALTH